jgi:hypothetical protein
VADIDPESWLLTPEIASDALDRIHVRAVAPVATFGCRRTPLVGMISRADRHSGRH